jgi:hypothetical protein
MIMLAVPEDDPVTCTADDSYSPAVQQLQGMNQVEPQQHAGLLNRIGVDPPQLQGGGYQQHLDAQQQEGEQRY